jgi:hypothetical protein
MGGNILPSMVRRHTKEETASTRTKSRKLRTSSVNAIPTNIGKRVTQPHQTYSNLDNSVKEYLDHMDKNSRLEINGDGGNDKKIKVLGISTTNSNDKIAPRKSTSEAALSYALDYAKNQFEAETSMVRLRDSRFKHCEGYYSKNAKACIFPCSISV